MASIFRPAVCLRRTLPIWSGFRLLSSPNPQVSTLGIPRTSTSLIRATHTSILQRQPARTRSCKIAMPASFHTSTQRQILPPGPRKRPLHAIRALSTLTAMYRGHRGDWFVIDPPFVQCKFNSLMYLFSKRSSTRARAFAYPWQLSLGF